MKKILVLLIAMVMVAMVLTACGSTGNEKTTTAAAQTQEQATEKETTSEAVTQEPNQAETEPESEEESQEETVASQAETEPESEEEPQEETAAQAGTVELTTINGTAWSLSYPASFTFEEGASYEGGLGQKNETKRGVLQGDYQIGICDGEVYPSAYENVEALNAQFKKSTIYEERELDGAAAYISQKNDYSMKVIIAYTDTNYICLNIISEAGDYQAIYESDTFNDILNSITFLADVEKEPLTTDNGYLSVTPVGGWYEGETEGSYQILLRNDSIGPVSTASFADNQNATADKLKEYVLAGFSEYSFETKTIGNNTFEVLDTGNVAYLIATSSTGKGIEIKLWNVKLDDAMELLETVEIK